MENMLELLRVITKEDGIILILILLLFIDRFKVWVDLLEDAYRRWTKIDRRQANKNLEEYAIKVGKIHEILEIYRKSLNASRVGYYVFHNGGKDIRGIPFLKYSCVNEAVAYGTRPRLKIDKDLQIATVSCLTQTFITSTPEIDDTANLKSNGLKDLLEEFEVIKYAVMPIYEDSLLSGFVVVEWKHEKYVPKNLSITESDLVQCAKMIEVNSIKDINHFLSY